ncbi:hypothetical protein [Aeromonas hydrophila]|uniref:hypothetical protein n=1 Tax=Aeromonas hydrophila TaxID=644 RepID=UPI00403E3930
MSNGRLANPQEDSFAFQSEIEILNTFSLFKEDSNTSSIGNSRTFPTFNASVGFNIERIELTTVEFKSINMPSSEYAPISFLKIVGETELN